MSTQDDFDHQRFAEFVGLYAAEGYVPATNETLVSAVTLRSIAAAMSAKYASAQMWQVYRDEGLNPRFKEGPCEANRAEFVQDTECCFYIDKGASSRAARHFTARFGLAWWLLHRRGEPFTELDAVRLTGLLFDAEAVLPGDAA